MSSWGYIIPKLVTYPVGVAISSKYSSRESLGNKESYRDEVAIWMAAASIMCGRCGSTVCFHAAHHSSNRDYIGWKWLGSIFTTQTLSSTSIKSADY